jgi:hypothetical protein
MFKKILIANRGDQRRSRAAAKLNGRDRAAAKLNGQDRAAGRGDFATGVTNV